MRGLHIFHGKVYFSIVYFVSSPLKRFRLHAMGSHTIHNRPLNVANEMAEWIDENAKIVHPNAFQYCRTFILFIGFYGRSYWHLKFDKLSRANQQCSRMMNAEIFGGQSITVLHYSQLPELDVARITSCFVLNQNLPF